MADRIVPVKDTQIVLLSGHRGRRIADYAKKILPDRIIVRSHRLEVKDLFFGLTAARIKRYAPCSVQVPLNKRPRSFL